VAKRELVRFKFKALHDPAQLGEDVVRDLIKSLAET
jgi:hypothetical protein